MKVYKIGNFSNGSRHQINLKKMLLCKDNKLIKVLRKGLKQNLGRSSVTGRITSRHKGGGVKRVYQKLESRQENHSALVLTTCYDAFRSSFIQLNFDLINNKFFYSLATNNTYPGTLIQKNSHIKSLKLGNTLPLSKVPVGSLIHSVQIKNINKYIRSAGTYGQLVQKTSMFAKIKLPSGKLLVVKANTLATLGVLSNLLNNTTCFGKAGKRRMLSKRPSIRGVAMNPVDHPHGGRTNGGCPSVTPWGIPTKGKPTLKKKRI